MFYIHQNCSSAAETDVYIGLGIYQDAQLPHIRFSKTKFMYVRPLVGTESYCLAT